MNDREILDEVLELKGLTLTDQQKDMFIKSVESVNIFCDNFRETVWIIFNSLQEKLKPIMKEYNNIVKQQLKMKHSYNVVRLIQPKHNMIIRKPILIHCRNNC